MPTTLLTYGSAQGFCVTGHVLMDHIAMQHLLCREIFCLVFNRGIQNEKDENSMRSEKKNDLLI